MTEVGRLIGEWVYHFQTLLTGFFAVAAACVTIYFIHRQISQNEVYRKDDIRQKLWLAKSEANFAVSNLHQYAGTTIDLLEIDLNEFASMDEDQRKFCSFEISDFPEFPLDDFLKIANIIPLTNHENAQILAEFVTLQQVYESRLRGFKVDCSDSSHFITISSFHQRIFERIVVINYLGRFFPFVRGLEVEKIDAFEDNPNFVGLFRSRLLTDAELHGFISKQEWPPTLR